MDGESFPHSDSEDIGLQLPVVPHAATEAIPQATLQATPVVQFITPRFCSTCGAAWQPHQAECETCNQRISLDQTPLTVVAELRGIKSAIALFAVLLGLCALGIGVPSSVPPLDVELALTLALSAATLIWCMISYRSILPLLRPRVNLGWFALALALSLASFAVAISCIEGYLRWTHLPNLKMSTPFLDAGYGWGMVILCICVQPAVIEELAFRGIIFNGLVKALSPFETVLVSALMFMILHLSPARFPHTLALGLAAGFLRLRSRSICPCMLLHFSHNLLCVLSERAGWW